MAVLVESYVQSSMSRSEAEDRIRVAVAALHADVRFIGSMFIPDDATAFFLFDGTALANVRRVIEHAGIHVDRLVEADADTARNWPQEV